MNTSNQNTKNSTTLHGLAVHTGIGLLDLPALITASTVIRERKFPNQIAMRLYRQQKLNHYQTLTNSLALHISKDLRNKIIAATSNGYGWTNIFQYFPTNHPLGREDQKYWAGVCPQSGVPIPSTPEIGGVPLILLFQGSKIGETRNQDNWIADGFVPIMAQLQYALDLMSQNGKITLHHRWVGTNGYIIEAVWDHARYQRKIDSIVRKIFLTVQTKGSSIA